MTSKTVDRLREEVSEIGRREMHKILSPKPTWSTLTTRLFNFIYWFANLSLERMEQLKDEELKLAVQDNDDEYRNMIDMFEAENDELQEKIKKLKKRLILLALPDGSGRYEIGYNKAIEEVEKAGNWVFPHNHLVILEEDFQKLKKVKTWLT